MSDDGKTNFLSAGINNALPQKNGTPPPPPNVRRARERNAEDEQTTENANLQKRKNESASPESELPTGQEQELGAIPTSMMTDEQVRMLAQMLTSANAATQPEKKAKRQKIDLAELLIETIANCEGSEVIKEQFSKLANLQKRKINQGVFAPEALFTIYSSLTAQMKIVGKKVTMSDLMAKALIAYIPAAIQELEKGER